MSETWDAPALREFVRLLDVSWRSEGAASPDRDGFRRAARRTIAPTVRARVLESVGVAIDEDGVAILTESLLDDGAFEHERRWLLVAPDPWAYLADWVAQAVARSYRRADGTPQARTKELRRLEKALRADG